MKLRGIYIMIAVLTALVVVFIFLRDKPDESPAREQGNFVWRLNMMELRRISINLPRQAQNYAWIKRDDHYFYFDELNGPRVDPDRWGGGIPLLLSGPAAARTITVHVTEQQLSLYGLDQPSMQVDMTLDDGRTLRIEAGDRTPDGQGYYLRRAESKVVYTVDYTWFDVLQRLVLNPPYPVAEGE